MLDIKYYFETKLFCLPFNTVGVGFNNNFSMNIVNESATWLTAKNACAKEVLGSDFGFFCTGHCAMGIANSISSMSL